MHVINLAESDTEPGLQLASRSSLLIGSNLLKLFVQLAIIFLYSRSLPIEQYGLYQSVWLYINVISIISLFGLPSVLLSASLKSISSWIKNNMKWFLLFFLILNILPLLYVFFGRVYFEPGTRFLLITLTICQNISILAETIAVKNEKEFRVLTANIIFTAAYFLCHFLILQTGYNLTQLLYWLIAVFILKTLLLITRKPQDEVKNIPAAVLGKQWLFLGFFDVVSVLFKWLDKWLILYFVSVAGFAIYFNGAYEIPVFALMVSAVGNIMVVTLSKTEILQAEQIRYMFTGSSLFLAAMVFPAFSFLLFYHHEFFTLLFTEKYLESIPIFLVTIFVLPVRITNFTAALQVYHRSDIILKGAVLDLLAAIILMFILYPVWKLPGLAAAFVASTYIQAGYYLYHTSRLVKKPVSYFFPLKALTILIFISITVSGIGYYLVPATTIKRLIYGSVICILLVAIFLYRYFKKHKQVRN